MSVNYYHHQHNHCGSDHRVLINLETKDSYDAFIRQDQWSFYELFKVLVIGIPILVPTRGVLVLVLIIFWFLFTKLFIFSDWLTNWFRWDKRKQILSIDELRPGSIRGWLFSWLSSIVRLGLFFGGFYQIHRKQLTSEELFVLRFPIQVKLHESNDGLIRMTLFERVTDGCQVIVQPEEEENQDSPVDEEPCYTIVSNHISMLDIFLNLQQFGPLSMLGKGSLSKIPIGGTFMRQMNCLLYCQNTRNKLLSIIRAREIEYNNSKSSKCRLIIYPEGTTTNGRYLIKFHRGAFANGSPVQPVVIHHPFTHFSIAWECISSYHFFIRLLSQFVNYCTVIHFPVYYPTEYEKRNPDVYAENVRTIMSEAANLLVDESVLGLSPCFFNRY